jgi:hypothetical protein
VAGVAATVPVCSSLLRLSVLSIDPRSCGGRRPDPHGADVGRRGIRGLVWPLS